MQLSQAQRNVAKLLETFSLCALAFGLLTGFGPYRPAGAGSGALGVGDAQVATGVGSAALYANPAGMSQVQHGVIETGFARSGQAGSGAPFTTYVDSTSSWGLAAGVGYARELGWTVDAPARAGQDLRLGLSAGGQSDAGKLMLGGSARYLSAEQVGKPAVAGWTADFGAVVGLQDFRIGAVMRNAMTLDARESPRRIATGVGYVGQHVVVEAGGSWGVANGDALPADAATGQSYRAGGAVQFGQEGLQLRGGYQFDQIVRGVPTHHWVCGGLSWRTPRVGFDLSGAVDAAGDHAAVVSVSLSFLIPYETDGP